MLELGIIKTMIYNLKCYQYCIVSHNVSSKNTETTDKLILFLNKNKKFTEGGHFCFWIWVFRIKTYVILNSKIIKRR